MQGSNKMNVVASIKGYNPTVSFDILVKKNKMGAYYSNDMPLSEERVASIKERHNEYVMQNGKELTARKLQ